MTTHSMQPSRRELFTSLGTAAAGLVLSAGLPASEKAGSKPLRGIFPIAQSPFTDSDKLDIDVLVEQVRFIDRGRVHGLVWPQLASEWSTLSETERFEGAEAVAAAGKKLRPAIVLGVQGPTLDSAVRYAKHAEKPVPTPSSRFRRSVKPTRKPSSTTTAVSARRLPFPSSSRRSET